MKSLFRIKNTYPLISGIQISTSDLIKLEIILFCLYILIFSREKASHPDQFSSEILLFIKSSF